MSLPAPAHILILSQVVLSFGIPFAVVPLVLVSADKHIVGTFAIGRWTAAGMWLITRAIAGLKRHPAVPAAHPLTACCPPRLTGCGRPVAGRDRRTTVRSG
ncbi:MAG: divalent metal cation transporter [Streptosporangiaceae bacterium]|nr:divalent metal cation transporter [Streptosporangiaceae bacterium]